MRLLAYCLLWGWAAAFAADLSGTWQFSVDLQSGGHGEPTFVFEQKGETLTGTYKGPLGEYKIAGNVNGNQVTFSFDFTQGGQPVTATYTARIESAGKMSGKVEFNTDGRDAGWGKWVATRK